MIEIVPAKTIKKFVWVHQLFEHTYNEHGELVDIKLVKGYTNELARKKPKEKRKLQIEIDEEVEER